IQGFLRHVQPAACARILPSVAAAHAQSTRSLRGRHDPGRYGEAGRLNCRARRGAKKTLKSGEVTYDLFERRQGEGEEELPLAPDSSLLTVFQASLFPCRHDLRSRQRLRLEDGVELGFTEQAFLQQKFVDPLAGCQSFPREHGGILVTDPGIERGNDADGVFDIVAHAFPVRRDSGHATLGQYDAGLAQMIEALEKTVRDDGLEGIELELTRLRGEAYGDVVSDDFEGDLVDHFRNHRVDLPGHDA